MFARSDSQSAKMFVLLISCKIFVDSIHNLKYFFRISILAGAVKKSSISFRTFELCFDNVKI